MLRPSASSSAPPGQTISAPNASPLHGLLDPDLARRVRGLPRPGQRLSPAALALLRTEAYILLRADPQRPDDDLLALTADLAETAAGQERQHAHLPAVGGKLYLPVNAGGVLAARLRDTVRALELDGAYSATLGTWLIRLPPARSYAVAGRLIDALIALEILPNGAILPHHLTVSGDLGERAKLLSLIHLAALPLILSERPGTGGDQRPFIMRGGGVLDDLDGRGRASGPRTDFVDGFLFVNTPGFTTVEQLTAHTVNLRTKQLLAHGLRCTTLSAPTRLETQAANHFWSFENGLRELLAAHDLAGALDVLWLDTGWNTIWPYIARLSQIKQQDPAFIPAARSLRDAALEALERT